MAEVVGALILCGGVAPAVGFPVDQAHRPVVRLVLALVRGGDHRGHRVRRRADRAPQGRAARATLTGLAAGLVFGIQDALTRQTLEIMQGNSFTALFSTWPPYCLVGAGIVGMWLMQNAFSAGPLHASLPTIAAGEPMAGIALGIVVFGDRIQVTPGQLAIEAGGIAALIVGVVAVARSSAFCGLRKITEHPAGSAATRTARQRRPRRTARAPSQA